VTTRSGLPPFSHPLVILACLCLLRAASPVAAGAQEALVLSGGGSRGLAHAGVLMGMEELGFDPDIVVGTSMGAVVGALYAAGYEPEEIRQRMSAIDWAGVFTSSPVVLGPDRAVRYPLVNFDLKVGELRFARGLIAQWRINRALAALLFDANARARGDFNRLARRYRAIAADLETGDAVVLAEGDLARAARASMAVPGIFAPVVWNDQVLVDGGIVNNLPIDVARQLGARQVIAVDVGRPGPEIIDQSPFGVIERALDLMQERTQRDPVPPDLLVLPDIEPGFGGANFPADPTPLFDLGLAAARRDLSGANHIASRGERPLSAPPDSFVALRVEAADSALAALARRMFRGVAPGRYDPDAVLAAMDRLYTTGLLEAVWPQVVEDSVTGGSVLVVRLDAPPGISLATSAGYDNDRGARAWVSLNRYSSIRRRPIVGTISAGTEGIERWAAISAQIYARNPSALSWSSGAYVRERDIRFFMEDALGNSDAVRAGVWGALEFPHVLRDQLTSATLRAEWVDIEDGQKGFSFGPLLRFTRLNPEILTVGQPFLIEGEHRRGEVTYSRMAVRASPVLGIGGFRIAPLADFRWTSSDAPADVQPSLGDEQAIPGLQWGEERGSARAVLGLDASTVLRPVHLRVRARTGAVDRVGWEDAQWVTGGQVGFVWYNPLGTAEFGYGANTLGKRRFDISIGRSF
jgi:predicted acylesterase/phospholipase RssA